MRHCALSLVGEPIMYPKLNAILAGLHQRRISSFLVTNAQFPEQLRLASPKPQCRPLSPAIDAVGIAVGVFV